LKGIETIGGLDPMGNNAFSLRGMNEEIIALSDEIVFVIISSFRHRDKSSCKLGNVKNLSEYGIDRASWSIHLELDRSNSNSSHNGGISNMDEDWLLERRECGESRSIRRHIV
jgi:hypothetical protein